VQKGDIMHEYAIEMGYEDQLIIVVSQDEALRLLSTGNYDCALVAKILAHYWIDKNKLKNLKIGEKPILSSEYCFAFPFGNEVLAGQFSEGIAALKSSGEHRSIYSKWLGVYEKPELHFIDIVKYSLFLLIPIFLLLVGFIVWNRSLGRMVRKRTTELQNEIESRSLAEKKLFERGKEIELLLNSTAEAIYGLDLHGNCSFVNNSCLSMLGYKSHSDLIGKNMHEIIHNQTEDLVPIDIQECEIYKALQSGQNIHVDDEVLWRADGSSFHAEYWSHPQFREGEITGAVVTFLDITERKKAAKERLLNEEKLVELNATKDKFFSLIAHDLKNPIGTIISFLDLLKNNFKSYDNNKIEKYIGSIHQAANQSYNLLENLLVWGQSQTGRIENIPQALDIRHLIEESVIFVKPQAAKKKIKIETSIEKNDIILIDRNLVLTVLRNMLSNAVKYSNFDDTIKINVLTVDGSLLISVKDNGIGMTDIAVKKLFKIDKTQSLPGTANEKGTGLGLLICHEFVDKIGGKMLVESAPGKGSDFQLYLPMKA
jgi:PAS domain S-box-containing protein